MAEILIITDQERLEGLLRAAGKMTGATVRIAHTLDSGIEAAKRSAPSILFIQNHLSGLSAEIVAKHIKGALKGTPPRFVIVGEGAERVGGAKGVVSASIDLSISDEEALLALREIITGQTPARREQKTLKKAPSHNPVQKEHRTEPPTPPVKNMETASREDLETPPHGNRRAATPFHEKLEAQMDDAVRFPETGATNPHFPPFERPVTVVRFEEELDRPEYPIGGVGDKGGPGRLLKISTSVLAVATLIIIGVKTFHIKIPARALPPADTLSKQTPPPTAKRNNLPSFISPNGEDPEYGITHAGWERYISSGCEVKLFRENGAIKALQVIDRTGEGLPAALFRTVLQEMTGGAAYVAESRESKDNFSIEKGTTTTGTRVITYKRLPAMKLKAFVIYFK